MNFGIAIFPLSWHLGLWSRPKKTIFAFGPLRFIRYARPGEWKPSQEPKHDRSCSYPKTGCICRAWETSPLG